MTGDIVIIPFPFAELTATKVRPVVVVCTIKDILRDVTVCAVSSVLPQQITVNEMLLQPDSINNLRAPSVLKVDRICTIRYSHIISTLGKLNDRDITQFKSIFRNPIESA